MKKKPQSPCDPVEDCIDIHVISTCMPVAWNALETLLMCLINRETNTPYPDYESVLLHMYGKMNKEK